MFVFEYQQQEYIGLEDAYKRVLNLSLTGILDELGQGRALCFYYREIVVQNGENRFFEGLLTPEWASITTEHIQAAIHYAKGYVPATNNADAFKLLNRYLPNPQKPAHEKAFTLAGKASTLNGTLGKESILLANSFPLVKSKPEHEFSLLEFVLPYYLVPVQWLNGYVSHKGIPVDFSAIALAERIPVGQIEIERGSRLKTAQTQTLADRLEALLLHQKQKISGLEEQIASLKKELEAGDPAAIPAPDKPSRSALRLIAAMAKSYWGLDVNQEPLKGFKEMHDDLQLKGLKMDDNTLRKLLRMAREST